MKTLYIDNDICQNINHCLWKFFFLPPDLQIHFYSFLQIFRAASGLAVGNHHSAGAGSGTDRT
jgi:hypothetical protein